MQIAKIDGNFIVKRKYANIELLLNLPEASVLSFLPTGALLEIKWTSLTEDITINTALINIAPLCHSFFIIAPQL